FPRIARAVAAILANSKVVAPIDVLVRMGILARDDLEAWRHGRVSYLERVIRGSLSRLSRVLRILAFHCHDLNLVATQTAYVRHGKGPVTSLRFTKTGSRSSNRSMRTISFGQQKFRSTCPAQSPARRHERGAERRTRQTDGRAAG